jgi:hypothetical protein
MTAAAKAKAEIGRVMRPSFDEQQGDAGATALRAVRKIADLLTEEVIPRLSHATDNGKTGLNGSGRPPGEEIPGDVPHENGIIPQTVLAELAALQQVLSAESASALAALFRTATKSRAEGHEAPGTRLSIVPDRERTLAGRPVKVNPGVRIGPVGKQLVRILEHYPKRPRSRSPAAIVQRKEATMAGWCTVAARQRRSTLAAAASIPPDHAGCAISQSGSITTSQPTPSS